MQYLGSYLGVLTSPAYYTPVPMSTSNPILK
ncbi:hypothetical protein V6Z11_A02G102200 [Gossypium hirsutum]